MHHDTFSAVSCFTTFSNHNSQYDYILDGLELMFVGIGLITIPLTIFLYVTINKRREKYMDELGGQEGLAKKYSAAELREMGDRAPDFVYTL